MIGTTLIILPLIFITTGDSQEFMKKLLKKKLLLPLPPLLLPLLKLLPPLLPQLLNNDLIFIKFKIFLIIENKIVIFMNNYAQIPV
jgi:hypothetical protein